jgi:hypothetical protein
MASIVAEEAVHPPERSVIRYIVSTGEPVQRLNRLLSTKGQ